MKDAPGHPSDPYPPPGLRLPLDRRQPRRRSPPVRLFRLRRGQGQRRQSHGLLERGNPQGIQRGWVAWVTSAHHIMYQNKLLPSPAVSINFLFRLPSSTSHPRIPLFKSASIIVRSTNPVRLVPEILTVDGPTGKFNKFHNITMSIS
jgi:hypothetical protein